MLRCAHLFDLAPVGDQQVLVWGTSEDLRKLGDVLRAGVTSRVEQVLGDVESPSRVFLIVSDAPRGMRLDLGRLIWEIAPSDAMTFAQLVDGVATSARACHQYLDCEAEDGIEVKVSVGEYPDDFRP
ncbi:hypothetical protein NKI20_28695 [Mesorhizobium sp. M0830]|uniref:hypothetical protein n=1 Tax=Mesorhizobium sp. M0830 TaxID=2957008 RepID=UPI00333595A8